MSYDVGARYPLTLTGTGNGEHDLRRMPGTDTSDLAETLVGLARKHLGAPTGGDTGETVTLGDGNFGIVGHHTRTDLRTLCVKSNSNDLIGTS